MQHKVLSIAGLDPSGGAGVLADIKTFSALGCYGMGVITAITAQNTKGVSGVFKIDTDAVVAQLQDIIDDIMPDAIKIGMLFNEEIILAVADMLKKTKNANPSQKIFIVLDPVMMAKSGDPLLEPAAIKALKQNLIPLTDIITPNLREGEALLAKEVETDLEKNLAKNLEKNLAKNLTTNSPTKKIITEETMAAAGQELLKLGSKAVLLKGGHLTGTASDDFYIGVDAPDSGAWLRGRRVDTKNTHGTGCTLSSAIASWLARGKGMEEACRHAKEYLNGAVLAVEKKSVGGGTGPLHHFYNQW